jgi:hypothetical protein
MCQLYLKFKMPGVICAVKAKKSGEHCLFCRNLELQKIIDSFQSD